MVPVCIADRLASATDARTRAILSVGWGGARIEQRPRVAQRSRRGSVQRARDPRAAHAVLPPEQIAPTCDESLAGVLALAEWMIGHPR
ncbi:MAG: hypothetical protein ACREBE_01275 [bacterium]